MVALSFFFGSLCMSCPRSPHRRQLSALSIDLQVDVRSPDTCSFSWAGCPELCDTLTIQRLKRPILGPLIFCAHQH